MKGWKGIIIKSLIIITFSTFIGFLFNLLTNDSLFILSTKSPSYREISLSLAKERFDKGAHLFLDAREESLYRIGHIKGSVNLPLGNFNQMIEEFEREYPKGKKIIVYCGGSHCSSSYTLAKKLMERGYREIEVFFGGWNDWIKSSFPSERSR
ncbi:MAG: rhodanese-like domain-containing protein [Acidobacteriota bacterium]